MGLFTREEKFNKETGKFEVTKKGLPSVLRRKEPTGFDKAVNAFEKIEKKKRKEARQKKFKEYSKKIDKARSSAGKHFNPDMLSADYDFFSKPRGGSSKKKRSGKGKSKYIIRDGVAYKVAGSGSSRKKGKKKSKKSGGGWLDPFDMDMGGF